MKVAIVTGGSRGIGRQVVRWLATEGFAVVVNYAANQDDADLAVKEVVEAGRRAIAVRADVADEVAVAALFDRAEQAYGGVDVVVHAAGRTVLAPIADLDLADLDDLLRVNVRGTFVVNQQAARRVRAGGAIINFSASAVALAAEGHGAYAASKGAVEAITLILARELRGRDVTVNTVAPGPTATDGMMDDRDDVAIAQLATQPPLQRLGTPEDIAEVVAFLAGPASRWVNGQVVRANGGIV
ncbi:SDR family oxidoreductase [Phytohabitans rumicis]|uniref:3-ketoacyl-ACP reductase n=1 Tax=Phytohabitans rumicis TaxID=1076125 RepID=A0A6V8LJH1_9ACTN|nr:SDR family oxidoreductase [Phytohabitans rumicis]GFJ96364.1 3-ketoacyl-ACP reductase [Phytohabitans rumicis]